MASYILACSGPAAMRVIQDNILYAQQQAVVVGALAVLSGTLWLFVRRFKGLPICVSFALLVHPAWTISATKGDCGYIAADAATSATVIVTLCVVLQAVASIWPWFGRKVSNRRLHRSCGPRGL